MKTTNYILPFAAFVVGAFVAKRSTGAVGAVKEYGLNDSIKNLRQALKYSFPKTKFSVTRGTGTAYGYVSINWTDGPTQTQVDEVADVWEGEGFDGMQDMMYNKGPRTAVNEKGELEEFTSNIRLINTSRNYSLMYNWYLCSNLDLSNGQPPLMDQLKNFTDILRKRGRTVYFDSTDYGVFEIITDEFIDHYQAQSMATALGNQGYTFSTHHANGESTMLIGPRDIQPLLRSISGFKKYRL